jgi:hypothetical protein
VDPCQEVGLKYGTITKQRTDKFGVGFLLTQPALPAARRSLPAPPLRPDAAGPELQSADKVRVWFGDASLRWARWASYRSGERKADSTVSVGGPDKARSLHLKSPPHAQGTTRQHRRDKTAANTTHVHGQCGGP